MSHRRKKRNKGQKASKPLKAPKSPAVVDLMPKAWRKGRDHGPATVFSDIAPPPAPPAGLMLVDFTPPPPFQQQAKSPEPLPTRTRVALTLIE